MNTAQCGHLCVLQPPAVWDRSTGGVTNIRSSPVNPHPTPPPPRQELPIWWLLLRTALVFLGSFPNTATETGPYNLPFSSFLVFDTGSHVT